MTAVLLLAGAHEAAWHCFICFVALLRIGESLSLHDCNCISPKSAEDPQTVVLILPRSKRGFDERIVLRHPAAVRFIVEFQRKYPTQPGALYPCTYARFRRLMVKGLRLLGLVPFSGTWRPHSLRRGGATALLEAGWNYGDIQLFGRWSSERSCREYLRRGSTEMTRFRAALEPEVVPRTNLLARSLPLILKAQGIN